MYEMLLDCGLLIGNLTLDNVNAYQEIGVVMGKAMSQGEKPNVLLILDTLANGNEPGFNIRALKQIRFTETTQLERRLRPEIIEFFNLEPK